MDLPFSLGSEAQQVYQGTTPPLASTGTSWTWEWTYKIPAGSSGLAARTMLS